MTAEALPGGGNGVVGRAFDVGLARADEPQPDFSVRLSLTAAQRGTLAALCSLFDLSTRATLNAAVRYALHVAAARETSVELLPEYPRRLSGKRADFELTADTRAKVRDAGLLASAAACAVAGLALLAADTLGQARPSAKK